MDWLTDNKIPVGRAFKDAFEWLRTNAGFFFDGVEIFTDGLIETILYVLNAPHPLVIVAVFVLLCLSSSTGKKTRLVSRGQCVMTSMSMTLVPQPSSLRSLS